MLFGRRIEGFELAKSAPVRPQTGSIPNNGSNQMYYPYIHDLLLIDFILVLFPLPYFRKGVCASGCDPRTGLHQTQAFVHKIQ
jgi:hypothetical protein